MNCYKTEGWGYKGTREQRLVKKEEGESSWNWPLLLLLSVYFKVKKKMVEEKFPNLAA